MMRCVLSLLFAMAVGTVAFAAEPPANQPPTVATPSTEGFLASVAAANPDTLDARHQAILDDLKACDAASFDKAYVEAQYQSLRELAGLFRAYATAGEDARIRQFAQHLLLAMRSHFDDVSKLR